MGNFKKCNCGENYESDKLNVVLFVSRNKDNKNVEGFKERRNAFTTTKNADELFEKFEAFAAEGKFGEMSRMYFSVNPRSNAKTFKALQHKMLDQEFNLSSLPQKVAALAALKENAYDSQHLKWLFDFDQVPGLDTKSLLENFLSDLQLAHELTQTENGETRPKMTAHTYKTPNGYAVVVDQRFDTRELLATWTNVTLKRDDLLCVKWAKNE